MALFPLEPGRLYSLGLWELQCTEEYLATAAGDILFLAAVFQCGFLINPN